MFCACSPVAKQPRPPPPTARPTDAPTLTLDTTPTAKRLVVDAECCAAPAALTAPSSPVAKPAALPTEADIEAFGFSENEGDE